MRNFKLPSKKEINLVYTSFSKRERTLFIALLFVFIISAFAILGSVNKAFLTPVPLRGGSVSIGLIGTPRFINPVLANAETDKDLAAFIYSGLMRKASDGSLIPDLAEKYDMSKNGLLYTFTLKSTAVFQDGVPVSADDVVFTINKVKDSVIKSPYKVNWDGVTVNKVDDKTVTFTLKQPYPSFLDNATIGIMPAHIWDDATPLELNTANTNPIGSGPYMISSVTKGSSGTIDSYDLVPFTKFTLGEAYIKNISLHFYQNEDDLAQALLDKKVDEISSIDPLNAENLKERNYTVESTVLPRVFGLFFNQNVNHLFTDKAVVTAISEAIDKDKIVKDVLLGYGATINSAIPVSMTEGDQFENGDVTSHADAVVQAQSVLAKDGWKAGADGFLTKTTTVKKKTTVTPLAFSISTGNVPELSNTAERIKKDLAAIGIQVEVKTFETSNLNQNVIRPRKYDALLFGEIINHESDLFAFWHSSQRKDPGLNVAMYTNAKVDKILEDASTNMDDTARAKDYSQFSAEVQKDMPAVFLYSPDFIYIVSPNLRNFAMDHIISPSDRYSNVYQWYTETENVWKVFAQKIN